MFTSVPLLILFLSIMFLFQSAVFYFVELPEKGFEPLIVSLGSALLFFFGFLLFKRKPHFNHYSMLNFGLLVLFYFIQFYLLVFLNIRYLGILLLFIQCLSGYYLLSNRFFYGFTFFNAFNFFYYLIFHEIQNVPADSLLTMVISILLSLLIHMDRRKSLITLADSYEKQKELNNRFRQLEENIRQVFILCTADFKQILYVSSTFESLIHVSRDEFMSNPPIWRQFIHHGDRMRVDLEMETALKEKKPRDFDCRIVNRERVEWLRFQLFPFRGDKSKSVNRFAVIVDDVTGRKEAELQLAEARSLDGEMAARIQKNFLFSDFDDPVDGIDCAADSIPSLDVGGDYYDIYKFSPQILDIIIADVMGKGRTAALLGAASKSAFMKARLDLAVKLEKIPPIDLIVSETSRSLSGELMQMGKFITLQYARLHLEKGFFEFVDKGHTSILHYSARLNCFWSLKGWNMPMGFNPGEKEVTSLIPVEEGDLFFLYSDGIIEAENEEGEQFGERRLTYLLKNSIHLTSNQIINKIMNIIFHYSSSDSFSDDITCIALKVEKTRMKPSQTNLILEGRRESLHALRSFTDSFLKDTFPGIDSQSRDALIIALNEAVANVIEHNYEKEPQLEGREIYLEAEKKGTYCCFRLFWNGEEFDWSVIRAPELSELKSGGYGVSLMKEIMDSVSYSSNIDGVQQLIMIKEVLSVQ